MENGLEYHHDGRVTTREELECYVGFVNFTITFIVHFLCLFGLSRSHFRVI